MRRLRKAGFTLIELIMVIAVVSMLLGAIVMTSLQLDLMYRRTSVHTSPEDQMNLAFWILGTDFRHGIHLNTTASPTTWLQIVLPLKDANGFNVLAYDEELQKITVQENPTPVNYFLGTYVSGDPRTGCTASISLPGLDDQITTGNALFKATGSPVNNQFTNAVELIGPEIGQNPQEDPNNNNLKIYPMVPDPNNPGQEIATNIFAISSDQKLVTITLTVQVIEPSLSGKRTVNHTLSTQFALRNAG
ncbi:MAG: PulJ/GspJ family protein [Armatimonadota bacterium]